MRKEMYPAVFSTDGENGYTVSWLNHKAEEKQLNFSQILQRALKQELELI